MMRRPRVWLPVVMLVAAVTSTVTSGSAPARAAGSTPTTYGTFHVVDRAVLADTRTGTDGPRRALAAHETRRFAVAGHATVPSSGVAAVLVQVSAVHPAHPSSLLIWNASVRPHIAAMPAPAGRITSETLPVGLHSGSIAVTNGASATDVRVVIEGWWGTAADSAGVQLRPMPSVSILDATVHAGQPKAIDLFRTYRIPGNPKALLLGVVADSATSSGSVTLSPDGSPPSSYPSDLAVVPGGIFNALSLVAVSTQYEQVTLSTSSASVHVRLYLVGSAEFPEEAVAPDALMRLDPVRVFDTLNATSAPARPMRAGETRSFRVAGQFGVPDDHLGAVSVAVTVTARDPVARVRLSPYRAVGIDDSPVVAHRGQPVMVTRVVRPGSSGEITVSTDHSADVEVDVLGYWTANALSVPNLMVNALAAGTMTDTPSSGLRDLTFSPDGAVLYAADVDSPLLRRYDVRYGIELAPIHLSAPGTGLDLSPDGRTALVVEPNPSEGSGLAGSGVTTKVESVDLGSGSRSFVPTSPTLVAVDVARMSDGTLLYAAPGSTIVTNVDRTVAWADSDGISTQGRWDEVDRTWLGRLSGYTLSVDDDATVVSSGPDSVLFHPADGPERTTSIVQGYPPGCPGVGLTSDGTRLRRVVGRALQDVDTETGAIVGQDQLPDDCDSPYYPLSGEVVVGPGDHTIAIATRHGLSLVLPR